MFVNLLFATLLQIGPFWHQRDAETALCPLWSTKTDLTGTTTDVLWPFFTAHRDWWRFCWFVHYQEDTETDACQFSLLPLWFNGQDRAGDDYWGLFPFWGRHPHILFLNDWEFCFWPLWMRYTTPRPREKQLMTTHAVLFPFFHWRDDGSWGVWPLAGFARQRESDHAYAFWPFVTWAHYRSDRDTAGAGTSWMFWPFWADVSRERESQTLVLPPLFSFAATRSPVWSTRGNVTHDMRVRCPWPFFEWESGQKRDRLSLFPFYERAQSKRYRDGAVEQTVTRWGWRLIELYADQTGEVVESRVFPFWLKNKTHTRVWPFWSTTDDEAHQVRRTRCLDLMPIRWVEAIDRNWAPYWTFYESVSQRGVTDHSLFWGIVTWRTHDN